MATEVQLTPIEKTKLEKELDDLRAENEKLEKEVDQLEDDNSALEDEVTDLKTQVDHDTIVPTLELYADPANWTADGRFAPMMRYISADEPFEPARAALQGYGG